MYNKILTGQVIFWEPAPHIWAQYVLGDVVETDWHVHEDFYYGDELMDCGCASLFHAPSPSL
jgi:hypothetical protein